MEESEGVFQVGQFSLVSKEYSKAFPLISPHPQFPPISSHPSHYQYTWCTSYRIGPWWWSRVYDCNSCISWLGRVIRCMNWLKFIMGNCHAQQGKAPKQYSLQLLSIDWVPRGNFDSSSVEPCPSISPPLHVQTDGSGKHASSVHRASFTGFACRIRNNGLALLVSAVGVVCSCRLAACAANDDDLDTHILSAVALQKQTSRSVEKVGSDRARKKEERRYHVCFQKIMKRVDGKPKKCIYQYKVR